MEMEDAPGVSDDPASTNSTDENDKPLLGLIKRLVCIDNSEPNTTVENSLLKEILSKEFDMCMESMSELQNDIYMNVLKKFLKSWPRWDEFDKLIKLSTNNPAGKTQLMTEEYIKLKEYLQTTLSFTEGQLDSILNKIQTQKSRHLVQKKPACEPAPITATSTDKVVMEVCCSRDQLNQLFYWKPHPRTLTIFNITEEPSSTKISINGIRLKEVLNWPHVSIYVTLPNFELVRRNTSNFERTLVNNKLPESQQRTHAPLSPNLYYKLLGSWQSQRVKFRKNVIVSYLVQIGKYIEKLDVSEQRKQQLLELIHELKSDLLMLVNSGTVSCEYQYFLSKYPYLRRLCSKEFSPEEEPLANEKITEKLKESINPNDFDLHLEEIISPAITFQITKFWVKYSEDKSGRVFDINYSAFTDSSSWLKIECNWCDVKFDSLLNIDAVIQHFNENHTSEPDWQCSKCNKAFTMTFLAGNRWLHDC